MRLLRSCCVCHCKGRPKEGNSDRESVSGSETGAVAVAEGVDHPTVVATSRRHRNGSKRRQRATYRYEVVYRREEFSTHDYLDHPVQNRHPFRTPEGADQVDSQPPTLPFQSADYSLLSNYGRLEDFHPTALHTAVRTWEQQQQPIQSRYTDQPLYQNFGGMISCRSPRHREGKKKKKREKKVPDWTLTPFPCPVDVCWQVAAPIRSLFERRRNDLSYWLYE